MTAAETMGLVCRAWAAVFRSTEPGPDDDFIQQGGHSLIAMRLAATLRAQTGRRVGVEDIFAARTPAGLTARVDLAPPECATEPPIPTGAAPALSAAQRRLWFVERLTPGMAAHNIAMAERLRGRLDIDALRRAVRAVVAQQAVLRWRIHQVDGAPTVVVDPPGDITLTLDDVSDRPAGERDAAVSRLLDDEAATPFDLANRPLWRVRLIRTAPDEHLLAITVHHIVFDGWSRKVLYQSLGRAYQDALLGREDATPVLPATFADYVAWLIQRETTSDASHWRTQLAGVSTVLDLPTDRPRPATQTFRGAGRTARLDRRLSARLRSISAEVGATAAATLLAVFGLLLRRLTGRPDLIVGTPVAVRGNEAFEPLIGLCIQVLPVCVRIVDDMDFRELVRRCHQELVTALAHSDLPWEQLVAGLGSGRDLSRNPLIQVLFNMYDFTEPCLDLPGVTAQPVAPSLPGSLFDLTLYVSDRDEQITLQVTYNPDLFDADRIEAMLASYLSLAGELATEPARPVRSASLRPSGSALPHRSQPRPDWRGAGVVELIRERGVADPDALAVRGSGGELTRAALLRAGAGTAEALREAGVVTGDVVAVLAGRDVRLPAALLGVLAAGARWVVLDPAVPPAALARQLAATRAQALIRFPGTDVPDPGSVRTVLDVTAIADGDAGLPSVPLEARGYLSLSTGTTGQPNPILTSERPLAHFLHWYPRAFGLGPTDRFAFLSGLAHDPALRDLFAPLVLGAQLHVPDQAWLRDPGRLLGWLRSEQITVIHVTPQLARLLTATGHGGSLPDLRLAALGGDQMVYTDAYALRDLAPQARIVNFYGTTETPQAQAFHLVRFDGAAGGPSRQPVPVGRGIDGVELLVLDPSGRLAGVGELGEVVVQSPYLATGYLDPELTARRFAATTGEDQAVRWFRTGDLGRYRCDGTVVLSGRADDQVKIRGFRVELGEVESVLLGHPDVRTACVTLEQENGEGVLCAYAVPTRAGVRLTQLNSYLRANLPDYAVPGSLTLLSTLPLNHNGKVDRAALRRPAARPRTGGHEETVGRTERLVAGVWREVLGLPRLGATDNFFELGGHSLALITVQERLASLLGEHIAVVDLFRYPSIRTLAAHIDGTRRDDRLDRAARRGAQRRQRVHRISHDPTKQGETT